MEFVIQPNKGFSSLPLNISRSSVRLVLSGVPKSHKGTPWDINESYYYDDYGLRLSFDEKDNLESIGFLPDTEVFLIGIKIKKLKLKKLLKKLLKNGYRPEKIKDDDEVLYFDIFGLAIFLDGKKIEAFELYSGLYLERMGEMEKCAELYFKNNIRK